MSKKNTVWAEHALTAEGWKRGVQVDIDAAGRINSVGFNKSASGTRVGILLPAMANLHSHAFQRAMAGMTETRGSDPRDSFWSWRKLMYRFLDHLSPDDVEAIAAFGQMEMLEAGYASVGEFHYLHHQPDGKPYAVCSEMAQRMVAAASGSGIGLTLLPVLYQQGGCDGRALSQGQKRFGNSMEQFIRLYGEASFSVEKHLPDGSIGIAPHSLRAVNQSGLTEAYALAAGNPFHVHIAEQDAEVEEFLSAWNARPVQWLLDNQPVDNTWCLVHATQLMPQETRALAQSGAIVGLCPITESNLGDGIFDGANYQSSHGRWGIGTDSNVRISLSEELRTLEYSQRLRDKGRAIYAEESRSTGRVLFDSALSGGAQALQRSSGKIATGQWADLLAMNLDSPEFVAVKDDAWLDSWIFAGDDSLITDVWSAGRHKVRNSIHVDRKHIEKTYVRTMKAIAGLL